MCKPTFSCRDVIHFKAKSLGSPVDCYSVPLVIVKLSAGINTLETHQKHIGKVQVTTQPPHHPEHSTTLYAQHDLDPRLAAGDPRHITEHVSQ